MKKLLILIELIVLATCQKIIEMEYLLSFDTFFIKVDLGGNEKYLQLDLHSKFNIITKNRKYIFTETVKKDFSREFVVQGRKVNVYQYIEQLAYRGIKLPDFYFYFYDDYFYKADTITFAYNVEKNDINILNGLKENGTIDNLIFGFSKVDNEEENGIMYLGGIPEELNKYYDAKRCNVDSSWGCNITKITVGDLTYDSTGEFGYFQTSRRFIFAPPKFIKYLYTNFLNDLFDKKQCYQYNNEQYVFCDTEAIKNFPNITLAFGEIEIVLTKNEIFEDYGHTSLLTIYEKHNSEYLWMLGYRFFKNYPIFFDKDKNQVIIFYNEGVTFAMKQDAKKNCIILTTILCFFSLVLLLYSQYKDPIILKDRDDE